MQLLWRVAFGPPLQNRVVSYVMATPEEIEAVAAGMYGKNWYSPDDQKRPGEKMKDVWRRYAKDAAEALDRFRAVNGQGGLQK
jgi:hypothetical protein